jgi:hypothetical protein
MLEHFFEKLTEEEMRCTYFQQNSTDTLKKFIEGSIDCVSLMNKQ